MNVREGSQKSHGTQNKSVFQHGFTSYLRSGTTKLNPVCHVSSPHIIRTPKVPPPERTTDVAQTCCWCEDMNSQSVSDLSRDRQLLSGSAGTGTQICLPSQHPHEPFASSWDISHWEEEQLPDGEKENVKHSNVSLLNMILEIPRVKWILYSRHGAQDFSKYVFCCIISHCKIKCAHCKKTIRKSKCTGEKSQR